MTKKEITRKPGPKTSPRITCNRIGTRTQQLSEDLNYASSYGSRCSWTRIRRKKDEIRGWIDQLPASGLRERLRQVTEKAWRAAEEQHHDRPDPEAPLLAEQRELLDAIRSMVP